MVLESESKSKALGRFLFLPNCLFLFKEKNSNYGHCMHIDKHVCTFLDMFAIGYLKIPKYYNFY